MSINDTQYLYTVFLLYMLTNTIMLWLYLSMCYSSVEALLAYEGHSGRTSFSFSNQCCYLLQRRQIKA